MQFEDKDYTHEDLYKATINTIILENRKYMIEYFAIPVRINKKNDSTEDLNQNNVDMLLHENEEKNKTKN